MAQYKFINTEDYKPNQKTNITFGENPWYKDSNGNLTTNQYEKGIIPAYDANDNIIGYFRLTSKE